MAKAAYQARWRQNTERQRIEAYLPVDLIERLDTIARRRGMQRPAALAALIEAAAVPGETPAANPAPDEATRAELEQRGQRRLDYEREPDEPPVITAPAPLESPPYTLRRAKGEGERGYTWIVETADGPVCGLKRNSAYHAVKFGKKWCGRYLKTTWSTDWAYGKTRDAVAGNLLRSPEVYR